MKRFALLLGPLLLAACTTSPPAPPSPTAALGQVATLDGIRVRPLKLLEDSRCPTNVQCAWAGRLRLLAELYGPDAAIQRELTLGKPVAVSTGRLSLIAAQPEPLAGAATDPAAYRFTFRFEPGA